jgi:hypothetical protein
MKYHGGEADERVPVVHVGIIQAQQSPFGRVHTIKHGGNGGKTAYTPGITLTDHGADKSRHVKLLQGFEHAVVFFKRLGNGSSMRDKRVSVPRPDVIQIRAGYETDRSGALPARLFERSTEFIKYLPMRGHASVFVENLV